MDDSAGTLISNSGSFISSPVELWNDRVYKLLHEKKQAEKYGLVMIWHRWIDENLTQAIKCHFVPNTKTAAETLFKYPGGLSSFSARVLLARCTALFGEITYADLKIINDLRNGFAHPKNQESGDIEILGFDNPDIEAKCKKLKFVNHSQYSLTLPAPKSAEDRFVGTASGIAFCLWLAHIMPNQSKKPEAIRTANTIRDYLP